MAETRQSIIEQNYAWFLTQLSGLLPANQGRYALIRGEALIGIYDSPGEAEREGERQCPDEVYSIQPVEDHAVDMGYFSHALN